MNTRHRDFTILSTSAVVLTEPANSQMVGKQPSGLAINRTGDLVLTCA